MRFICTEFDSNINNLYKRSEINQAVISEDGNLLTKSFRMKTTDGILYGYLSDTAREIIYSQFLNDGTFYTPSEWIAAKTTGTDYTGITQDFIFQNSSIADIVSSYFYTIISDNGVYFSLPERNSSSKEIKSYTVIDELENYETDYSFQNETGKTFTLSESIKDTIIPLLIDSTLKSNRINKYKSKQNTRTIQTGSDANPLDYIQINGTYYILISKSEIKNNYYQYICVKEEKESNSISASDILQKNNNYDYQYIGGQTYNGVALNVTATNGTLVRGVFIPYKTSDGSWRLRFNLNMTFSPAVSAPTVTIAGVTFKNVSGYAPPVVCNTPGANVQGQAGVSPNSGSIGSGTASTVSSWGLSGDVELESKPTWAY
jgi:hypothetical protein